MGCSSSKQSHEDVELQARRRREGRQQQAPLTVSAPTGGPVMVPPVYRDSAGRPITHTSVDLSRTDIQQALRTMSEYLQQRGATVNAVTVGGAVNTLYLRSRESTHDVDFFLNQPNAPEHGIVHEAARHANRRVGGALGADWFNNSTQFMMGRRVQEAVAAAAFQQNTIVFQSGDRRGGLRIYAAPWSYAFCGKLNRLCTEGPRSYDLPDAVVYLHEYLQSANRRTVGASEIYQWCKDYGKNATETVLQRVEVAYQRKYKQRAIV